MCPEAFSSAYSRTGHCLSLTVSTSFCLTELFLICSFNLCSLESFSCVAPRTIKSTTSSFLPCVPVPARLCLCRRIFSKFFRLHRPPLPCSIRTTHHHLRFVGENLATLYGKKTQQQPDCEVLCVCLFFLHPFQYLHHFLLCNQLAKHLVSHFLCSSPPAQSDTKMTCFFPERLESSIRSCMLSSILLYLDSTLSFISCRVSPQTWGGGLFFNLAIPLPLLLMFLVLLWIAAVDDDFSFHVTLRRLFMHCPALVHRKLLLLLLS